MPSFPIHRYLVPEVSPEAPPRFQRVEVALRDRLPERIALDDRVALLLVVPTGLAATWRDLPADALVSSSALSYTPRRRDEDAPPAAAARLHVLVDDALVGSAPLVASQVLRLPEGAPKVEVVALRWELRAGTVRGGTDAVSTLELAWRRSDRAVEVFGAAPLQPTLLPRLKPEQRIESTTGTGGHIHIVPLRPDIAAIQRLALARFR